MPTPILGTWTPAGAEKLVRILARKSPGRQRLGEIEALKADPANFTPRAPAETASAVKPS